MNNRRPPSSRAKPARASASGKRVVGSHVALEHQQRVGRAVGRADLAGIGRVTPHGLVGGVGAIAARQAEPFAQLDPLCVHLETVHRHQHGGGLALLVEGPFDLAIHALEALLGKGEVGGALVQPLEHRLERRLWFGAPQAVEPQVGGGPGVEGVGGASGGGQEAQARPSLRDELLGQRAVVVEARAAAGAAVLEIELDLGPGGLIVAQHRGRLQCERVEGVVQLAVAHRRRFAAWPADPAAATP
ncbi:MAG: hypothetical protein WKF40_03840 [Thermoleophilaceae bacterium]